MSTFRLGDILIDSGVIDDQQLNHALDHQRSTGKFLGDVLIELGYAAPVDIAKALSLQLDIPVIELGEDFRLTSDEVRLIPESVARRFCLVPVKKDGDAAITLVMRDPLDIEAIDAVRALTGFEVNKAVSTETSIVAVIDKYYREDAQIERNLRDIVDLETAPGEIPINGHVDADQLRDEANDAPVVRFVNLLLMQAVRDGASDIHFEPGEHDVTIRLRIDGVLQEVTPPPKTLYRAIVTRVKILSDMDIAERRLPLDGRFKFSAYGRVIDVRVSSLPEVHGEKIVLRILDRESLRVDMREIGFDDALMNRFQRVLKLPNGIVLLTGPTGSGKTTTLYSALSFLKSPEKNIQTVEDPVEYQLAGVNQMQIRPTINLDFANALRAILRQDPDIVLIGEIRDAETARIAMRASLTGHLVLSTLHTNDSPSAFWRLRDIGIEPFLIAATVKLVLSQRLVRALCERCRVETEPDDELRALAAQVNHEAVRWKFYRGEGCADCRNRGYRGRTAIFEFLELTDAIRQMVLDTTGEVEFRQQAHDQGMQTLIENGLTKVQAGITSLEEVLAVCPLTEGVEQ